MRRNLNQLSNGRRVLDTPRTGVLGSQVPGSGDDGGSIIAAEVTQYGLLPYEVRLKVESTNLPAGSWYAWPDGRLQTATVPDGRYTLNYSVYVQGVKQPGLGAVYFNVGTFPVTILRHPAASGVAAGQTTVITVDATGSGPLTYQWQKQPASGGGYVNIPGATSVNYTTPATTVTGGSANDGDSYRVVITNSLGSVTSNPSTLEVGPARALPTLGYGMSTVGGLTLGYGGVPTAEFIGVPLQGVTPLAVTFTNQSTGIYSSLLWEFGDGQTSSIPNPTHVYSTVRDYTVTLTLTWTGGTVVRTRTNYVTVLSVGATSLTLNAPTNGTVNIAATGNVQNTGTLPQNWTLSCAPAATLNPSSGTTAPGSSTNFTITSDVAQPYQITLTNTSGGSVVGSPDTISIESPVIPPTSTLFTPRNATSMLFQPLDTYSKVVTTVAPHPYPGTYPFVLESDQRTMTGPTAQYIDFQAGWEWQSLGGDWLDLNLTPQGSVPWGSSVSSAANNTEYNVNVTTMYQHINNTGAWAAFFLHYTVGIRVVASRRHSNVAYRPKVEVTYSDSSTETLDITCMAAISNGSSLASTWTETQNLPVAMESRRPNAAKTVTSAILKFTVTAHFGSAGPIIVRLANPPVAVSAGPAGIAATTGEFDAGIDAEPGVILAQRYVDGAAQTDFISTDTSSILDPDFDPILYGIAGPPDPGKFPQRSALKWINAGDLTLVNSSYTADGFEPLAPGLGAIKVTIPATTPMEEGYVGTAGGALGTTAKLFLPLEYMSTLQHGRMRYYVRFAFERPLSLAERKLFFSSGSTKWVDFSGKFGPSFNHNTPNGGVSATSGSGLGWQGRLQWQASIPDTPGPDVGGINLAAHIKSDYSSNQPTGYNYSSMGAAFNERFGQKGGYGGMIQERQWHLVEIDFKLNTVTNSGDGFIPDGHWRVYLNNQLVLEHTGLVMRTLPINNRIGAPVVTPGVGNVGNGTFVDQAGYANSVWANDARAIPETIVLTFTSATSYTPVGSFYGTYAAGTVGVPYVSARYHKWQVNAGGTPYQAGDTITLVYSIYGGPGPRVGTLTQQRDLGIRDLWFNWFHGGLTEPPMNIHGYITGLVVADGSVVNHIGPMHLPATTPSWVSARTLNTWGEIPTSNTLAALNPDTDPLINPNFPLAAPWRSTGNWNTITSAWNGMAFDEVEARGWFVDTGGHNDQHANGVIKFDLNSETPSYTRVRKPSGAIGESTIGAGEWNQTPQVAEFSDGRPRARHTVNMTFYWPGVGPGNITEILLSPSGGFEFGRLRPYVINELTGERSYLGANKNNEPSGGWCASCYDSLRNVVWKMPTSASVPFSRWGGPSNDVWTDVGSPNYFAGSVSMTYIPGHDVILVGNGGNDAGNLQTLMGGWAVFDPVTGILHTPTFTGAPTSVPSGDPSGLWPGIVQPRWAASLGAVLAWDMDSGQTTKVLRLTPPVNPRTGTWVIDYLPLSGSNTVVPAAAPAAGTYGKFFVWDDARICGVITSAAHGGYFFRYG